MGAGLRANGRKGPLWPLPGRRGIGTSLYGTPLLPLPGRRGIGTSLYGT